MSIFYKLYEDSVKPICSSQNLFLSSSDGSLKSKEVRNFTRAFKPFIFVLAICIALFSTPAFAGGGGNGDAKKGSALPIILAVVGAGTVAWGVAKLPTPFGYVLIAGGIAEIAGAIIAGKNNAKTDEQTKGDLGAGPEAPASEGGMPAGLGLPPGTTLGDLCAKATGVCTCSGTNCSKPSLQLPTDIDTLKAGLEEAYKNDPNAFDGKSLEDALAGLDNNFSNAQKAFADFNKASENGTLGNGLGSEGTQGLLADNSTLQGLAINETTKNDNGTEKTKQGKVSQNATSDSIADAHAATSATTPIKGSDFSKSNREAPLPVKRHGGLVLEDERSGRLLTLFERLSRAIRGSHDRDLILAKVEWARKDLERREKNKKNNLSKNAVATSLLPAK